MGSQRLEQQAQGLHGSVPGPLHMLWLLVGCFVGLLTVGEGMFLTLLPALETLFSLLAHLSSLDMRVFALSYCVLF